jgi:8-oxo-dGTP pyrophosphatase MutT (NUDIX family)
MKKDNKEQSVVAIIQKDNQFLWVKRSDYKERGKGVWCPVSGGVKAGETEEEAVQREVMEEVGLNVVADKKICIIPSHDNQDTLHFWTTKIISGDAKITSQEAIDMRWVTLDEIKNLEPIFEADIQVFESLRK